MSEMRFSCSPKMFSVYFKSQMWPGQDPQTVSYTNFTTYTEKLQVNFPLVAFSEPTHGPLYCARGFLAEHFRESQGKDESDTPGPEGDCGCSPGLW